jgi:hypothetical protein
MQIIKFLLALLGVAVVGLAALWVLGWVWSMLWYIVIIGALGTAAVGGYRLFRKIEDKALGNDVPNQIDPADINMSWDEYDKKYLHK